MDRLDGASDADAFIIRAIELLRQRGLLTEDTCHLCGGAGPTTLVRNRLGQVARACDACHAERRQMLEDRVKALRRPRPAALALVALIALLTAGGWCLLWQGYDLAFRLLRTDSIDVPDIVLFVLVVGIGVATSYPLVRAARFSSLVRTQAGWVVPVAILALSLVAGELAYWTLRIYWDCGILSPASVARNVGLLLRVCDKMYLGLKAATFVMALAMACVFAKHLQIKQPAIDLKAKT